MKAISLWQPWASLIAAGAKQIETRGWSTDYRGEIAIHAAAKWSWELYDRSTDEHFKQVLYKNRLPIISLGRVGVPRPLPLGQVICTVEIVKVVPTSVITFAHTTKSPFKVLAGGAAGYDAIFNKVIGDDEIAFGDYSEGRFAWLLAKVRPLKPFPFRGRQMFFDVPDKLIEEARSSGPTIPLAQQSMSQQRHHNLGREAHPHGEEARRV